MKLIRQDKDLVTGLLLLLVATICAVATYRYTVAGDDTRTALYGAATLVLAACGLILVARKLARRDR